MVLSAFSVPRGFLGVPPRDPHFAPAVELHVHNQLQARPIKVRHTLFCSCLNSRFSSCSTELILVQILVVDAPFRNDGCGRSLGGGRRDACRLRCRSASRRRSTTHSGRRRRCWTPSTTRST
jgi:hypothetical protein